MLQVAASAAGILRGKWKLVIAAPRCLRAPEFPYPHTEEMPTDASKGEERFKADRFLLWNVHARNCSQQLARKQLAAAAAAAAAAGGGGARRLAAAPPRGRDCAARQEGGKLLVLHNGSNAARLAAARRAGAVLQLFDVHPLFERDVHPG